MALMLTRTENSPKQFTASPYRADIDGLRAVAVIAVVVYHAFPTWLPLGFLGVDVFFVISGFLITRIIADEIVEKRFSLKAFYARRVRRLFPALAVVLLASVAAAWIIMLPTELERFGRHIVASVLFVSNFQFWSEAGYFDKAGETKPLLHLWSLSVEEQFYLCWPLLLMACWRARIPAWAIAAGIAAISFAIYIVLSARAPGAAFYLPFSRFWELMLGALIAVRRTAVPTRGGAALAVIGMLALAISLSGLLFGGAGARTLSVFGSGLMIAVGAHDTVSKALSTKPAVAIGLISYPLYLWHWPILSFLHIVEAQTASMRLAAMAVSVLLAAATYWFVERPIRFGRLKAIAIPLCAGAMSLAGIAGAAIFGLDGVPARFPADIRSIATAKTDWAKDARVGRCWLSNTMGEFASECTPSKNAIWIWGDSHAARLYVGLEKTFGREFQIGQMTRDTCAPLLHLGYERCQSSNDWAMALIEKSRPSMVILFARWGAYAGNEESFLDALTETIVALKKTSIRKILIVGPAPEWEEDLPTLLIRFWRRDIPLHRIPDRMSFGLSRLHLGLDAEMGRVARATGTDFVSLMDILCDTTGCMTKLPPAQLTTTDQGHLTEPAADYISASVAMTRAISAGH
ncbi:Peptidoglycan/LPS O-acetylase OafA/YrhL, contains acyltransferase and SGNH-hydrolase domains [Rhizobiales bacterium GAS113]|nr:Peptidoglycan/LPS O-acetylase OafA/YrhL, contains acyltransferase and SGNH-hydrolase domains [Rhizobiales bacterium GAS113]